MSASTPCAVTYPNGLPDPTGSFDSSTVRVTHSTFRVADSNRRLNDPHAFRTRLGNTKMKRIWTAIRKFSVRVDHCNNI